jgi:branched-chain amino acid transport system ATP-binding protein
MTAPLLSVRGLRTGYAGIPVVFKVDLDVSEGEVVALLGANGAGKTTTLRAISGMIKAMSGDISFAGERIANRPADQVARLGVVHVPEGRGIFPSLRVEESLKLAASFASVPRGEVSERIDEVYATFPRLAERRWQTAGTLSGGEQQMLSLSRALIARPKLLLVDEMSQGLAPTVVANLFEILATLPKRGVSVLLVEQFVGQALGVASRAYVLEKGEITYAGSARDLAADEDFVRGSYLGDVDAGTETVGRRRRWSEARDEGAAELPAALPQVLARALEEMARRDGVPVAELIRQALHDNRNGAAGGTAAASAASRGGDEHA